MGEWATYRAFCPAGRVGAVAPELAGGADHSRVEGRDQSSGDLSGGESESVGKAHAAPPVSRGPLSDAGAGRNGLGSEGMEAGESHRLDGEGDLVL